MGGGEVRLEFQRFSERISTQVEISDVASLPAFLDVEITQAIIEIGIWPLFQNLLKKQDVAIDGRTLRTSWSNTEKANQQKCGEANCSSDWSTVLRSWLHLYNPSQFEKDRTERDIRYSQMQDPDSDSPISVRMARIRSHR
jgi:hypothetical protein